MAEQRTDSLTLTKALRTDPIIGVEIHFQKRHYPAKEIARRVSPGWVEQAFETDLIFDLVMFDCTFTDDFVNYMACSGSSAKPSVNAVVLAQSGKKAAIMDAYLAEYNAIYVTLLGGIYTLLEETTIDIPGEMVRRRQRLEAAEKKNPLLKRFRNLLED